MEEKLAYNITIYEIKERSSFTEHLIAALLFIASKFQEHQEVLSERLLYIPFKIWNGSSGFAQRFRFAAL